MPIKAIDRVREAAVSALRSITIPEWGDLTLHFGKLTIADQEAVEARTPKTAYERQLIMLIHKAKMEDGTPAFQMGDMHYLRNEADFVVVQRIVAFMYQTAFERKGTQDPAQAAEGIKNDPPSASDSSSPSIST